MTTPGQVRLREPVDLSTLAGPIHVKPGETLYLLTYQGVGFTKAWFRGKLYEELDGSLTIFNDVCSTDPTRCVGQIVEQPQRVWWVQLRNAKGQTGWTNEPGKFDGKDALGS